MTSEEALTNFSTALDSRFRCFLYCIRILLVVNHSYYNIIKLSLICHDRVLMWQKKNLVMLTLLCKWIPGLFQLSVTLDEGKENVNKKRARTETGPSFPPLSFSPVFVFFLLHLYLFSLILTNWAGRIALRQKPFSLWTHLIPSLSGHLQSSPAVPSIFSFYSIRRTPFVDRHSEPFPTLSALKKSSVQLGTAKPCMDTSF